MTSRKTPKVSLRPAEEGDGEILWRWRNEESTRKWSFNSDYIPYEEHKNWFLSKLNSVDSKLLVVLDENKNEIGQVRFDIGCDGSAEVNISIEAEKRNKGYGNAALRLACQYAMERFNIAKVIGYIKEKNQASIEAFKKAGFVNEGEQDFKGHRVIKMIWELRSRTPSSGSAKVL